MPTRNSCRDIANAPPIRQGNPALSKANQYNHKLALLRPLGGRGDSTNSEQLFAGGYAACIENASYAGNWVMTV
jgi:hypothetical protein